MTDMINHPPHYKRGKFEVIDIIEAFRLNYRLGNVVKYILRAGHKGSRIEDLRKAAWYLAREIAADDASAPERISQEQHIRDLETQLADTQARLAIALAEVDKAKHPLMSVGEIDKDDVCFALESGATVTHDRANGAEWKVIHGSLSYHERGGPWVRSQFRTDIMAEYAPRRAKWHIVPDPSTTDAYSHGIGADK